MPQLLQSQRTKSLAQNNTPKMKIHLRIPKKGFLISSHCKIEPNILSIYLFFFCCDKRCQNEIMYYLAWLQIKLPFPPKKGKLWEKESHYLANE